MDKTTNNKTPPQHMTAQEFHEKLKKALAEIGVGLKRGDNEPDGSAEVYIPLGRSTRIKEGNETK